mmetsp:Transcript_46063/g.128003  ORF Transcript_46063/g.128003 Transcript_46063/m.128003 type:complete len:433 (+) Transcript_46063:282-1580(+)
MRRGSAPSSKDACSHQLDQPERPVDICMSHRVTSAPRGSGTRHSRQSLSGHCLVQEKVVGAPGLLAVIISCRNQLPRPPKFVAQTRMLCTASATRPTTVACQQLSFRRRGSSPVWNVAFTQYGDPSVGWIRTSTSHSVTSAPSGSSTFQSRVSLPACACVHLKSKGLSGLPRVLTSSFSDQAPTPDSLRPRTRTPYVQSNSSSEIVADHLVPPVRFGAEPLSYTASAHHNEPYTCTSQAITSAPSGSLTSHSSTSLLAIRRTLRMPTGADGMSAVLTCFCNHWPSPASLRPRKRTSYVVAPARPATVACQQPSCTLCTSPPGANSASAQATLPRTWQSQPVTGAFSVPRTHHFIDTSFGCSFTLWKAKGTWGFGDVLNGCCNQAPPPTALMPWTRKSYHVSPCKSSTVASQRFSSFIEGSPPFTNTGVLQLS